MRHTQLVSKWPGTRRNVRLFWWSGSVVLPQLTVALIAINAGSRVVYPGDSAGIYHDRWPDGRPAVTVTTLHLEDDAREIATDFSCSPEQLNLSMGTVLRGPQP